MTNDLAKIDLDDELSLWHQFTSDGNTQHLPRGAEQLKLNGQSGRWVLPKTDPDTDLTGMELVADCRNIHHGWTRFEGNRVTDARIVKAPGRPARRAELGDEDKTKWELGLDGKTRKDPWSFGHYLPLVGREQGETYIYITSSTSGGREIKNLAACYVAKVQEKGNPDRLPIVKLDKERFKSRFGSRLFAPVLTIVAWRVVGDSLEPADTKKITARPAKDRKRQPAKVGDADDDFDQEIEL
jgi:hypothetical protein